MPIFINNTPTSYADQLGQGVNTAIQNYLATSRDMQKQQQQHLRGMTQLGMMAKQVQKEEQSEAAKQAISKALGEMDFNAPDINTQLLKMMPQAPDVVSPILQNYRQQQEFEANEKYRRQQLGLQAAAQQRMAAQLNKPQYDQNLGGFVSPDGSFTPVQLPEGYTPPTPMQGAAKPTYSDMVKTNFAQVANIPEKDRTPEQQAAYQQGLAFGLKPPSTKQDMAPIYSEVVLQDIGQAKDLVKDYAIIPNTGIGALLSGVPGTKAHDLASTLTGIQAGIGFDRLQNMRANSPTGGALGAVSDKENALLQAAFGDLSQSQSEGQFLERLDRMEKIYLDIVHGPGNWHMGKNGDVAVNNGNAQPLDLTQMSDEELLRGL